MITPSLGGEFWSHHDPCRTHIFLRQEKVITFSFESYVHIDCHIFRVGREWKKIHPKALFVGKLNPHLLTKYVASTYEHYTK